MLHLSPSIPCSSISGPLRHLLECRSSSIATRQGPFPPSALPCLLCFTVSALTQPPHYTSVALVCRPWSQRHQGRHSSDSQRPHQRRAAVPHMAGGRHAFQRVEPGAFDGFHLAAELGPTAHHEWSGALRLWHFPDAAAHSWR